MIGSADLPVDIGRDEARQAAVQELAKPEYAAAQPSPLVRAVDWLLDRFGDLLDGAAQNAPGGYVGLVVLAVLLVLGVLAVRLRIGRIGRTATGGRGLFDAQAVSADQHRRSADAHAARGEWAEAVRERLRAVVRDLEERDLLDPRPGRTADEAAADGGRALPACAEQLRAAARTFDDVWYGGVPATEEMDARLRAVDEAVRRARPVPAGHAG
jgi:NAD(P)H-dependent FMN reductase